MSTRRINPDQPRRRDRYIYAVIPECPGCGGTDLLAYKTEKSSDGSKMQRVVSRTCSQKWKLVWERITPDSGGRPNRPRYGSRVD
jgi:hypothetical protein